MDELSIEMKKILYIALHRISTTDIRLETDRESYLETIDTWLKMMQDLEKDLLEAQGKLPKGISER